VFLTAYFGTSFVMKTSYNGDGMYTCSFRMYGNVFFNIYLKISYMLFKTNCFFLLGDPLVFKMWSFQNLPAEMLMRIIELHQQQQHKDVERVKMFNTKMIPINMLIWILLTIFLAFSRFRDYQKMIRQNLDMGWWLLPPHRKGCGWRKVSELGCREKPSRDW
jgi:hypothetical protein